MTVNETLIPVPGRLHSVASEGHVVGANEVFDDDYGESGALQSTINALKANADDVYTKQDIDKLYNRLSTYADSNSVSLDLPKGKIYQLIIGAINGGTIQTICGVYIVTTNRYGGEIMCIAGPREGLINVTVTIGNDNATVTATFEIKTYWRIIANRIG